jgi:hypothetical protein
MKAGQNGQGIVAELPLDSPEVRIRNFVSHV